MAKNPKYASALNGILDRSRGSQAFITLVEKFNLADRYPELLAMAQASPDSQVGVEAIRVLLVRNQQDLIRKALDCRSQARLANGPRAGQFGDGRVKPLLLPLVTDASQSDEIRQEAVRSLAKSRPGAAALVKLAEREAARHPAEADRRLRPVRGQLRQPAGGRRNGCSRFRRRRTPSRCRRWRTCCKAKGNAARGKLVFETTGTCAKCHVVNGQGKEVGPNLSEIGSKLSREAMFESILYPSAGISHNYETYLLLLTTATRCKAF